MFSFGGGKSSSSSQSQSRNVGISGSSSFSDSLSTAASDSVSGSSQSIANQDILDLLYGSGVDAAGKAAGAVPLLQGQAAALFSGGNKFLDSLGGGVDSDYLASRVSGQSPVLQEQIDALGEDLGRFFSEQLNPEITSEAVAGGTLGGGRQGVAQGLAAESVAREFQRGATDLRARDISARDSAAGVLGNQRIAGASAGLGSLPGMYDIAQKAAMSGLDPIKALSDIIGGPTVLTDSFGRSTSSSDSASTSVSESFGFNYGDSSSSSTSKSKNVSIGF